jgi:hypothetical protein
MAEPASSRHKPNGLRARAARRRRASTPSPEQARIEFRGAQ